MKVAIESLCIMPLHEVECLAEEFLVESLPSPLSFCPGPGRIYGLKERNGDMMI
jgi:hypothetical protein